MMFGSYIAGACIGDTLKGKLWSVRYFFNYPGIWLCQLIMGQSIILESSIKQSDSRSYNLTSDRDMRDNVYNYHQWLDIIQ